MSGIVFELCAEGIEGCLAAQAGGAHRIELCSALSEGGLTPSHALIEAAVRRSALPVYVMLRPRGGGYVYSAAEFALMEADLLHARALRVSGFVAGVLDAHGNVDRPRMRRLVELADGREVTFHRAFDETDDLDAALEHVIDCGCRRLLTSGGATDVETGAERLRALQQRAAGRIAVAAGGGLRLRNARYVAATSGVEQFHGSVRHGPPESQVRAADVRALIDELSSGSAALKAD